MSSSPPYVPGSSLRRPAQRMASDQGPHLPESAISSGPRCADVGNRRSVGEDREAEISRELSERTTGEIRAACVGTWTGECAMALRNWLSEQKCTDNCVLYGACPQPNAVVFARGIVTRLSYNTVHVDGPDAPPKRPAVRGSYYFTLSRLVFSSTVVRATSISFLCVQDILCLFFPLQLVHAKRWR